MTDSLCIKLPGGFIIENAAAEDIDEIAALETVCFAEEPWSRNMLAEEIDNSSAFFIVARKAAGPDEKAADRKAAGPDERAVKGQIAGYLVAWLIPPYECQIGSIAVLPEFRRKGIASGLLKVLCGTCSINGIQDIELEVRVSNTAAIELYKRFGFKITGVRKGYYQDGEDAYNMARISEDPEGRTMA